MPSKRSHDCVERDMSTTTTQILFNSPALHALKRDQLVNLCKIHSIKASGKNVDLIIKLQEHARTLPSDTVAPPHDDGASASDWRPRPSEQWEVMESIRELDESSSHGSLKTVGATGEFGTGSSKCTSYFYPYIP